MDARRNHYTFALGHILRVLLACDRQDLALVPRKRFTKDLSLHELSLHLVGRNLV